jgi:hypothetical protein
VGFAIRDLVLFTWGKGSGGRHRGGWIGGL